MRRVSWNRDLPLGQLWLGLLAALLAVPAFAQQTDNHVLGAVAAPGPVRIDGRLDDWDLKGEIQSCYDREALADRFSVRTAAMYDAEYLYVAFRFRDATPLVNHIDPAQQPGEGWRSDCVQLRLNTDRVLHIDCYYYTDQKRPTCHIVYRDLAKRDVPAEGEIKEAIGQGVEAAFRPDADGRGYVQEMRIAWRLLRREGKAYRAGESFRCGLEFFWGDATGQRFPAHRFADLVNAARPQREFFWANKDAWGEVRLLPRGASPPCVADTGSRPSDQLEQLRYRTEGPLAIEYDLPQDGGATLVIERPDGTRVRNLIADYPRRQGRNTDFWDGTDDAGRLVEPGDYRVRGLVRGPLDVRYQFTYGTPADPPWETADGRGDWLADHVPPAGVASDGEWTYLSCFMSEGGSTVIGLDATGQKRWGIGRITGGMLACDEQYLYMLCGGGHPDYPENGQLQLRRIDRRAGKLVPFAGGKAEPIVQQFPTSRPLPARLPEGTAIAQHRYDAEWFGREALGLAVARGRLWIPLFYENKLLVLDAESAALQREIAIQRPAGVTADGQGKVYVASGQRVLRVEGDRLEPVITEGLEAPIGLAADREGNLYVADGGKAMCVKVFSPDGRLLRTVGRPGGRSLQGAYDAGGMFRPLALAVDGQNRLWVTEYDFTPKRVSVWSAEGKLVREYCGPTWYGATECNVDVLDPRHAFAMGNTIDLDWKRGQWRVAGTVWRPTTPDALLGPYGEGLVFETLAVEGRQLLVASSSGPYLCISELKADGARPLAALGSVGHICQRSALPDAFVRKLWDNPETLAWARGKYPAVFSGIGHHRHRDFQQMVFESQRRKQPVRTHYLWTDGNGDGLVQDAELRLFSADEVDGFTFNTGWRFAYGRDLTLYPAAVVERRTKVWSLPRAAWNRCGAPVYRIGEAKLIYEQRPQYFCNSTWADAQGNVLLNQDPLTMITPRGKTVWTYPNRWPGVHGSHSAPKDLQGLLIGPLKVIGSASLAEAGEVFCLSGNMGKAFLMTTDGLYVGSLFRDTRAAPDAMPDPPRRGASLANTSPGAEWFGGEFFRNPADGKLYLGSAARNGSVLSEVTGLDQVRRLPVQTVRFTSAQYAQAAGQLAKRAKAAEEESSIEVFAATRRLGQPPAVNEFNWAATRVARWRYDDRRTAEATWTYDKQHLHLCFREVGDETPMVNGGRISTQLFKTGDAALLDLRIRPDDDRPEVIAGDLRLLVSVLDGRPIAVLYRYKVEGATAPLELASPVTTTKIDAVETLADAKVAIERQEQSYTVRVSVPLERLGFHPEPGRRYRGDFGIVYSDRSGRTNELRMHWANRVTGIVSDLAIEAQIEPRRWGVFQVKEQP